jgi:hypothetical protein
MKMVNLNFTVINIQASKARRISKVPSSVESEQTFQILLASSGLISKSADYFMPVLFLAYSSTLKMHVTCSSKTLVYFQRTTHHNISEEGTFYNHCCENLKSYMQKYLNIGICTGKQP